MGFFKTLKSLFDEKELGVQTIQAQVDCFYKAQRIHPDWDIHKILIEIYLTRLMMRGIDINNDWIQLKAVVDTRMFSCLQAPDCASALGLWILYKENSKIIEKYFEFEAEFQKYVEIYSGLVEANQFESAYKKLNPVSFQDNGYAEDENQCSEQNLIEERQVPVDSNKLQSNQSPAIIDHDFLDTQYVLDLNSLSPD